MIAHPHSAHCQACGRQEFPTASIPQPLLDVLDGSHQFLCPQVFLCWAQGKLPLCQHCLHIILGYSHCVTRKAAHEGPKVLHELLCIHALPCESFKEFTVLCNQVAQCVITYGYFVRELLGSHGSQLLASRNLMLHELRGYMAAMDMHFHIAKDKCEFACSTSVFLVLQQDGKVGHEQTQQDGTASATAFIFLVLGANIRCCLLQVCIFACMQAPACRYAQTGQARWHYSSCAGCKKRFCLLQISIFQGVEEGTCMQDLQICTDNSMWHLFFLCWVQKKVSLLSRTGGGDMHAGPCRLAQTTQCGI